MNTRAPFTLDQAQRIARAWLSSTSSGIIELDADWTGESLPLLAPGDHAFAFADLRPAPPSLYADEAAYFVDDQGEVVFVLDPADHSWVEFGKMPVYVAGDFNGWEQAIGQVEWALEPGRVNGRDAWLLRRPDAGLLTEPPQQFKFVTGDHRWLELPREATNLVPDGKGHFNRALLQHRTGRNLFEFTTTARCC